MFLRTVTSRNVFGVIRLTKRCYAAAAAAAVDGTIKSPYGDIKIPDETLPEFVWSRSSQWEDLPAMTCGLSGRSYTYGMAKAMTDKFAKGLVSKLPMKTGDRIGLLMPNLPEYLVAVHGCINAGFIPTFANPLYTIDELARQFANSGVRSIITIPQLLDSALAVAANLEDYTYTINAGGQSDKDKKVLALQDFMTSESTSVKLPKLNSNDVACMPYSSGTTGLPKGVSLTHRNLVANIMQCIHPEIAQVEPAKSIKDQERVLSVLPFFHIYGFNAILNFLTYNGVHTITIPKFTPKDYLTCLEVYKPTSLFAVPSLVLFMATHPDVTPKHLENVKKIICAAAPITTNIINKIREKINRDDFVFEQGYGMTEMSPVALFTPKNMDVSKTGSVGRLLPSTEAKLVNLDDNEPVIGPNKSGELVIRGPQIMKEYHNNPEATNSIIDSDGWLHTGDVAYHDEDGFFYIIDRTKELIKVKGNQVSPSELESILHEIPGVADCAVVGIADNVAGELPGAFIVKTPGSNITAESVKNYVEPKVAPYKKLEGGVTFVEAIPRNPAGKIMRHQLKAIR